MFASRKEQVNIFSFVLPFTNNEKIHIKKLRINQFKKITVEKYPIGCFRSQGKDENKYELLLLFSWKLGTTG